MAEQYDSVGSKYEEFKTTATLPIPERHTFLKLVGDARGQRVLDLACGSGHYSRLLKEQDRKSTRLNSSHSGESRMPSSA